MIKSKYLLLLLGVSVSLFSMEQNDSDISDTDLVEMKEISIDIPTTDNNSRLEQLYTSFPKIRFQAEVDREMVEIGLNEMSPERFNILQAALRETTNKKRFIYNMIARSQAGQIKTLRNNNEKLVATLKHDRKVLSCTVPTLGILLVYAGVISLQYFL